MVDTNTVQESDRRHFVFEAMLTRGGVANGRLLSYAPKRCEKATNTGECAMEVAARVRKILANYDSVCPVAAANLVSSRHETALPDVRERLERRTP